MRIASLPLSIALFAPTHLIAQQNELERIEVTAQFKTENVQHVPIAMSVLNIREISDLDIADAASFAHRVPGLTLAEFAPGQSLLSIRGIVSSDDGAGMDNSVVVFLDGVYIGRLANINTDLFDIERIEILRGPQGTISGRNTIGGAINIITVGAEDEFATTLSVTKGNYNTTRFKAGITGSLAENITGKLSINHRAHDGFTKNVLLNEDNQDENKDSIRAQLQIDSDLGRWRISADRTEDKRNDMGRIPVVNGNFDYIGVWQALGGGDFESTSPISGFSDRELQGLSINGVTDFTSGELTTILGWRNSQTDWEMASVGAPLGGNYDLSVGVFGADVNDDILEDISQYSMEFRWSADISKNLDYTTGLFYLKETTERIEQYKLDFNTQNAQQTTLGNEVSEQYNDTRSIAIYAQLNWQLNDHWQLTTGARFTRDDKSGRITSINCGQGEQELVSNSRWCASGQGSLGILQQSFTVNVDDNWTDFSPKVTLQYSPNVQWMLYGSIAKGYKSGGFPGSPGLESIARQSVAPEEAINYELGFKSDLLSNKLRLNGSVFYTDYRDLQVGWFGPSELNPGFGSFVATNIDDSEISGAELEFQWVASQYLWFTGNYAYLDTKINNFFLNTFGGELDLSGSALRQAPRHKSYLAADIEYPLANNRGSIALHIDYQFTDEQLSDYINQNVVLESHELINFRAAWTNQSDTFDIALWAKNLLQETYISHAYVIGPGIIGTFGAPRTYGITLNWRFN